MDDRFVFDLVSSAHTKSNLADSNTMIVIGIAICGGAVLAPCGIPRLSVRDLDSPFGV